MNHYTTLEFDKILEKLAENALSETVKTRCLALKPSLNETEVRRWMDETTQAKRMIEQIGTPPLSSMSELQKVIGLIAIEAMLTPDQITHVSSFLVSCRRMKAYLRKAEATDLKIAYYGGSINELAELENEIERCIRNGVVDDKASTQLGDIRRQIMITTDQMKAKLDALLRKNKAWFSEDFVSIRNGRYTLPVKREHKNDVAGAVIEISNTGGTCFIEPVSVSKLEAELYNLKIEEDSEVRRILYTLTALISDYLPAIKLNIETMETLDFLFAKGKLSISMKASPVGISTGRKIQIKNARHPLLDPKSAVPLNFEAGNEISGVIITGPNTGGKTVALKTVGLLSLMVQSGLHVPADGDSSFCMRNLVLCDIGDGQSIAENLSTFSSHMKNIIEILKLANKESLVLLDELGSGTDPAEGMGLAIAVMDELCAKGCLFAITTHYPEIKEYAANKPELVNAHMAFDKESLMPLYRLEIGEAGESCALYIAQRLGMPMQMLKRAHEAAYGNLKEESWPASSQSIAAFDKAIMAPKIIRQKDTAPAAQPRSSKFNIGDSVMVYPQKEIGIVYARSNEKGEIGVQIKGVKKLISHKRIKLHVAASELYPEGYDFSIVFDSVENRKARRILERRHEEGNVVIIKEGENKR
ncbi:endonuclease MutS2 [Marasmitruncus massiliensis]|uniref:endonuclease MutS2 n=1 Tax=Marasmitruncus massiliensis TaxID=1944642 RepID=UPI000C7A018D|nr:DNA mismatch repair protein MutS [Marasmitruncus massiliensis]